MKKSLLTERFQQLAGLKPLYEIEEARGDKESLHPRWISGGLENATIEYKGITYKNVVFEIEEESGVTDGYYWDWRGWPIGDERPRSAGKPWGPNFEFKGAEKVNGIEFAVSATRDEEPMDNDWEDSLIVIYEYDEFSYNPHQPKDPQFDYPDVHEPEPPVSIQNPKLK